MAAPSTEDLVIQMRVDMGRLEADLRAANTRLDAMGDAGRNAGNDVQSGMSKARGSVNDFGTAAAAAGAAAAAALAGVIASTLETVTVLNRLAGQTGMATEELQYYAAGARMLGVDQQELGDVFKDVQDKIGDFLDTGAGGMVDFFEQVAPLVGLTAEEFRHLGGAEALQLVYDSMEKVGLSSNQIVFQMEALASESTRLIPLLKNGGEGFKLFGDEAQRAGAIMSDELIRNTTQLKVEMNTLSTAFTGARNTIASDLIPTLIDIGNVFGDVSGNGEAMVKVSAAISTAVKVAALTAIGAIGAFKLFGESLAATGTLFQGFDFSKGLIQNMAVVAGNLTRDDSGFAFAMQGLQQTALGVADQINGISLAGLGDEIKQFSAGAQILTAPGGKGGTGGMRTTQAERDKQAAADKAAGDRAKSAAEAAARELEQQKKTAQDFLQAVSDQVRTEAVIRQTGYDRLISQAESYRAKESDQDELLEGDARELAGNLSKIRAASYHMQIKQANAFKSGDFEAAQRYNDQILELNDQELKARQNGYDKLIEQAKTFRSEAAAEANFLLDTQVTNQTDNNTSNNTERRITETVKTEYVETGAEEREATYKKLISQANELRYSGLAAAADNSAAISQAVQDEIQITREGYDRQIQQANAYYDQGLIGRTEYGQAIAQINRAEAEENAKIADDKWTKQIELAAAAGMAGAEVHEQDMAARIARAEQLRELMMQQEGATTEARRAMLLERHLIEEALIIEQFEAQLISKEERSQRLLDLDKKYKEDSLNVTRELFDGQHELEALYNDTTLKNAANFFAMDLGGFSKHSRKMFEVTKAAKIAQVALSIPKAVSDAYDAGNALAGPVLGAAYAATALVTKLGHLRDIRAATYGGGGGGGSSGGGGGGGSLPQPQEQQQPQIERFVNLSIIGESNDITSIGNVRNLIERINSEIQNGAVLRVN